MRLRITWPEDSIELSRRESKAIEDCRYDVDGIPPNCLDSVSDYYREIIPDGDGSLDVLSLCLHAIRCGGACVIHEEAELVNIRRLDF